VVTYVIKYYYYAYPYGDHMSEEITGKIGKTSTSKKMITIVVIIIVILATLLGMVYLGSINEEFYSYQSSARIVDTGNLTITTSISISPVLNSEIIIRRYASYSNNGTIVLTNTVRLCQIILPESFVLIEGEEKSIKNIGEEWDFSWKVKPTQTGDYYLTLGEARDFNISLLENTTLNYYDLTSTPNLNIIGLRVGEDSGKILAPEEALEIEYEIGGYKEYYSDLNFYPTYVFDVGDSVWFNVKFKPIANLPYMSIGIGDPNADDTPYLVPLVDNLDRIENLSALSDNEQNLSFRIMQDMNDDIKISSLAPGSVLVLGPDGPCGLDAYSDGLFIRITTIDPNQSTRSNKFTNDLNWTDPLIVDSMNRDII